MNRELAELINRLNLIAGHPVLEMRDAAIEQQNGNAEHVAAIRQRHDAAYRGVL